MTALITRLAEVSDVPLRRLASGTITANDWLALMATYSRLAPTLDAAEQDKLDVLLSGSMLVRLSPIIADCTSTTALKQPDFRALDQPGAGGARQGQRAFLMLRDGSPRAKSGGPGTGNDFRPVRKPE